MCCISLSPPFLLIYYFSLLTRLGNFLAPQSWSPSCSILSLRLFLIQNTPSKDQVNSVLQKSVSKSFSNLSCLRLDILISLAQLSVHHKSHQRADCLFFPQCFESLIWMLTSPAVIQFELLTANLQTQRQFKWPLSGKKNETEWKAVSYYDA